MLSEPIIAWGLFGPRWYTAAMSDPISPEIFDHLVSLAALELEAQEADYLRAELNKQLKAIDELAAIALDDALPITSHGVPYTAEIRPQLRKDDWVEFENPEDIIGQVPQVDANYILVPDIPHQELK